MAFAFSGTDIAFVDAILRRFASLSGPPDESACRELLYRARWPHGGSRCPRCDAPARWLEGSQRWECKGEKHPQRQYNFKLGTWLAKAKLPAHHIVLGLWHAYQANLRGRVCVAALAKVLEQDWSSTAATAERHAPKLLEVVRLAMETTLVPERAPLDAGQPQAPALPARPWRSRTLPRLATYAASIVLLFSHPAQEVHGGSSPVPPGKTLTQKWIAADGKVHTVRTVAEPGDTHGALATRHSEAVCAMQVLFPPR